MAIRTVTKVNALKRMKDGSKPLDFVPTEHKRIAGVRRTPFRGMKGTSNSM
jgi:hypothetical protein